MSGKEAPAAALAEPRRMRLVLALLCCFILYGSFIPFLFTVDPRVVRAHLATFQLYPFQDGRKNFSIPDVASNVFLFVPFGFLLAGSGLRAAGRGGGARRIVACGTAAAAFATAIEIGQLFTLNRTASLLDVMANAGGGVLGAAVARAVARSLRGHFGEGAAALLRRCPTLFPVGLLALAFVTDRFYPFAITLDVSTVWYNFTHAQWRPFGSLRRRFWADVVMDNGVTAALLAAPLRDAVQRLWPRAPSPAAAWMGTVLFAGGLEGGKLFFAGRVPNIDNVIWAALGALGGVTLIAAALRWKPVRARPDVALLVLALTLLAYAELTPFDFALAPAAIATKARRIEWLPLWSYYGANPQSALFDLWNKVLLSGFVGFAASRTGARGERRTGAAAGLLAGAVLEAAQVLKVTRHTSVTDVLIFGAGGYLGGVVQTWYRTWRGAVYPSERAIPPMRQ